MIASLYGHRHYLTNPQNRITNCGAAGGLYSLGGWGGGHGPRPCRQRQSRTFPLVSRDNRHYLTILGHVSTM